MSSWYYANGDDEVGPISAQELKALAKDGTIGPKTQVWKDGMADWKPATSIKGLLPKEPVYTDDFGDDYEDGYEDDYDDYNPYAAPAPRSRNAGRGRSARKDASGKMTQLKIAGGIILSMAVLTMLFQILGRLLNLNGGPNFQRGAPGAAAGFMAGQIAGIVFIVVFQLIAVVGATAMIRGKSYSSAIAGVVVSFIPLCGPCLGASIPFAIWALVLLMDPDVKASFS